jgi:hypothetical protein
MENQHHSHTMGGHPKPYRKLLMMTLLSFVSMYVLMYAMVDSFSNVFPNVNQFYMAALMTTPMVIIEILVMWSMYGIKRLNIFIVSLSTVALVIFFMFIRKQTAVSDKQFLKSMIPHHAAAILMVNETELNDPEIQKLARDIISAQQDEIEFMKMKLRQLETK